MSKKTRTKADNLATTIFLGNLLINQQDKHE
jgi:hypothetical protein